MVSTEVYISLKCPRFPDSHRESKKETGGGGGGGGSTEPHQQHSSNYSEL